MSYLIQGGWVMLAILLSSIVALAVFVERLFYLLSVSKNAGVIRKEMQERFRGLKVGEAISICDAHPGAASNIMRAGLSVAARSREEIERSMEDAAKYELPKLNRNLPILATIVNIATLLGLLGTVLGMITSTSVLASQGLGNPSDLIGGISQALVTTAAGLIVAIPGQVGYNYLVARIDSIILDIETTATELIKVLKSGAPVSAPITKRW
ncbi:biopolymer transport protein ExbB [Brevinema andersonii]|uniref:Biopolymer transport protein ExbB n=1 Tax=Brevinema andersonii TaxID=34097 RepID=A0A1I1EYQ9_BREAD|nr:MotA/TolQ/ExbB proton channel family protein [Brevinema andersonii]SFB90043.1 biopolymer transport protein ExbB [Brevinema andersonii]